MSDCSFCQFGYFQDLTQAEIDKGIGVPNDVKCDHCNGTSFCFKKDCEDCED